MQTGVFLTCPIEGILIAWLRAFLWISPKTGEGPDLMTGEVGDLVISITSLNGTPLLGTLIDGFLILSRACQSTGLDSEVSIVSLKKSTRFLVLLALKIALDF